MAQTHLLERACGFESRSGHENTTQQRRMNARNISVAKRSSVELMDTFIGPKT